ncbi:MAG TPA: hypothetical protein PKG60_01590 [Spirochaetota bacterium]|nr:hypothetical protein [Spirochaetota bacterium]HPS85853.1 hypothetical protein [Spirochaetota bacterium]
MTLSGLIALIIFFAAIFASLKGWISQKLFPMQVALLLASAIIIITGLALGEKINPSQIITGTFLHPITATIAGFILAGALKSAGAFEAASGWIQKLQNSFLGVPFAVIVLINIPTLLAMPCGRVWVSPLIPVALTLGFELARKSEDKRMPVIIISGLVINAAASCGPSLIGGIGLIGEGMGRYPSGSFSDHMQFAIMFMTSFAMILSKYLYNETVSERMYDLQSIGEKQEPLEHGAFSLVLFISVIVGTIIIKPAMPVQTILIITTFLIMIIAGLGFDDLVRGIILHPLTAMISGFIAAGTLSMFGGFDVLVYVLGYISEHTPLGYVGVSILLVYLPVFLPLPCGRIIAVSLIPGVLMFGEHVAQMAGSIRIQEVMIVCFILSGAASCGPSPLGGIGSIGEGRLRLKSSTGRFLSLSIFMAVPIAGFSVGVLGLSAETLSKGFLIEAVITGLISGLVTNFLTVKKIFHPGGLIGGLIVSLLMLVL